MLYARDSRREGDMTDDKPGAQPDTRELPVPDSVEAGPGQPALRRLRTQDRYMLVLVLILGTIVASAFMGDSSWGTIIVLLLQTATLLVALFASHAGPRAMVVGTVATAVVVIGILGIVLTGNYEAARLAYMLTMMAIVAVTPIVIVRRLFSHTRVTLSTVLGAACIYLLLGLFYSVVYNLFAAISHDAFFAQKTLAETFASDYIYYSYITIATVGFGDLTAASRLGQMITVTEALIGQLYLVTIVSLVVSNIGYQRRNRTLLEEDDD
jgi:hypothetical protein